MAAVSPDLGFSVNSNAARFGLSVQEIGFQKGKGLFAAKDFREGDAIFQEEPLVCAQFSWNALYKYLACAHCMKSLETSQEMAQRLSGNPSLELPYAAQCCEITRAGEPRVPCPQCQVLYCSEECRQKAWDQYHRTLCLATSNKDPAHPLNKIEEAWRNMHYPPETANIMLIARMIAVACQASNPKTVMDLFSGFCHSVVNKEEKIAHKLLGNQFQEQTDILRIMMREALFDERLEQWFTPEGFQSLVALLGTNGQGIGTSSLSRYVQNVENLPDVNLDEKQALDLFLDQMYEDMDRVSGQFLNCEGSGLYALQSCCNHSCSPNAEVTFPHSNSTLVLKALHRIQSGEEICICYLDECSSQRSRHSRQHILRENYLFNCTCAKCESQAGDPDVTSSEEESDNEEEEVTERIHGNISDK